MHAVVELVTWAATIALAVRSFPQAVKLLRSGRLAGVSTEAYALSATASACWALWGAMERLWVQLPGNAVNACLSVVVCAAAFRSGASRGRTLAVAACAVAATGVALLFGSSGVLAIAATITLGFSLTAAAKAVCSSSVEGVSAAAWVLQFAGAAVFVVWSAVGGHKVSLATASVDVVCSIVIVARTRQLAAR